MILLFTFEILFLFEKMSFNVFFEHFYLSVMVLLFLYFYITKGAKREWDFVPLYRAICSNALSPMVFKFISGSLSLSVSLEYLVL